MSKLYLVKDPEQLRLLASPIRSRLFELLRLEGHMSASKLAKATEIDTALALYHLGLLKRAGLVVAEGKQRAGQRSEQVFAPVAREVRLRPDENSEEGRAAMRDVALSTIRSTKRDYLRAHELRSSGGGSEINIVRRTTRISPEKLARARELLAELGALFSTPDEDGTTVAMSAFLLPQE